MHAFSCYHTAQWNTPATWSQWSGSNKDLSHVVNVLLCLGMLGVAKSGSEWGTKVTQLRRVCCICCQLAPLRAGGSKATWVFWAWNYQDLNNVSKVFGCLKMLVGALPGSMQGTKAAWLGRFWIVGLSFCHIEPGISPATWWYWAQLESYPLTSWPVSIGKMWNTYFPCITSSP